MLTFLSTCWSIVNKDSFEMSLGLFSKVALFSRASIAGFVSFGFSSMIAFLRGANSVGFGLACCEKNLVHLDKFVYRYIITLMEAYVIKKSSLMEDVK